MKKKSTRDIPDFSRQSAPGKAGGKPAAGGAKSGAKGAPPAPPRVKPPSTSAKGGQRGK